METGYIIGRIIGILIFPLLIMGVVGLIQYLRTKDKHRAKRAMFSWWSISLGIALLFLGLIGQVVNNVGNI